MSALRLCGYEFRPTLLPSIATIAMLAATLALGNWQLHRAEQKLQALEQIHDFERAAPLPLPTRLVNAADFEHRRLSARGEYVAGATLFLDNKVRNGVVGYEVLTPLRIKGGDMHVMVNRGWIGAGPRREVMPQVPAPTGEIEVEGLATVPAGRYFELGSDASNDRILPNPRLDRIAARTGLKLQPLILYQTNESGDGLIRAWQRRESDVDMHRGYALQWFLLTLLTLIFYVVHNVRKSG